jgi:5-methyltetrahydrofolate--homocysteine methyltransferase
MGSSFMERIQRGEILIADGATGTNLQARGLKRGESSEAWVLDQPNEIVRLHRDFIDAGADIILTCTFGASPLRLEDSHLADRAMEINRQAVALARQAAQKEDVLVAGSIGPAGRLIKPYGPLSKEEVITSYMEQAAILTEAGADLLVIETQFDLTEASAAIQAAASTSSLPVICSFSFDRGTRTMMGVNPTQMGREIAKFGIDGIGINCGRSLEDNLNALKELRMVVPDKPIWFKPNAGLPEVDDDGATYYTVTPEEMGAQVKSWLQAGAQIVGGCCGTTPEHLRQITQAAKNVETS